MFTNICIVICIFLQFLLFLKILIVIFKGVKLYTNTNKEYYKNLIIEKEDKDFEKFQNLHN